MEPIISVKEEMLMAASLHSKIYLFQVSIVAKFFKIVHAWFEVLVLVFACLMFS